MGDDEDAHVGARHRVDAVGDDAQGVDVQARVGLVQDGDLRALHGELEDLHALLLAAGEALVEVARGELPRHLGEVHGVLGGLAEVLERDGLLAASLAMGVGDHAQVLGHADPRHGDRILEGHEQAGAGALVRIGLGDVLAVEGDGSLGHLHPGVAHDRVGQRRLAGAVGAHQGVDLALGDGQVDALEDLLLGGADVQVANFEVGQGVHFSKFVVRRGPARRAHGGTRTRPGRPRSSPSARGPCRPGPVSTAAWWRSRGHGRSRASRARAGPRP